MLQGTCTTYLPIEEFLKLGVKPNSFLFIYFYYEYILALNGPSKALAFFITLKKGFSRLVYREIKRVTATTLPIKRCTSFFTLRIW